MYSQYTLTQSGTLHPAQKMSTLVLRSLSLHSNLPTIGMLTALKPTLRMMTLERSTDQRNLLVHLTSHGDFFSAFIAHLVALFFFHTCHQFQRLPLLYTIHKFRTCLLYNSCISMHCNVFTFEYSITHICRGCWFHVE